MKLNIKLRLKNKATLTALIATGALLANQICLLFGVDYSAQIEQLVNISGTVLLILSGLGVIVDGTTKGVSDSGMAMELTKPRDENVDPVEFINEDGSTPIEYEVEEDNVTEEEKENNPKG